MFIVPGEQVYEGQIIGENSVKMIWTLTPARKNTSATCVLPAVMKQSADSAQNLLSGTALEHINDDELVEVTPKSIRMRKKILDRVERGRLRARNKQ